MATVTFNPDPMTNIITFASVYVRWKHALVTTIFRIKTLVTMTTER